MRVITEHYEVAGPGLHRLAVGVHVYSALQHLAARAARGRVRLHSAQSQQPRHEVHIGEATSRWVSVGLVREASATTRALLERSRQLEGRVPMMI
ncbi:MAG: hypothetical protein E6I52_29925 [Chloroflexi bacterium]|nr:MAG: hypothetical protein E6I52_29925 [Chloroflexota bacterium]